VTYQGKEQRGRAKDGLKGGSSSRARKLIFTWSGVRVGEKVFNEFAVESGQGRNKRNKGGEGDEGRKNTLEVFCESSVIQIGCN